MYFLQWQDDAAKLAEKAIRVAHHNGWLDDILESPIFWIIVIIVVVVGVAALWESNRN